MRNLDDIEELFDKFHGAPGQYQDIFQQESAHAFKGRWPILSMFDASAIGQLDVPSVEVRTPPLAQRPALHERPAAVRPSPFDAPLEGDGKAEFLPPMPRRVQPEQRARKTPWAPLPGGSAPPKASVPAADTDSSAWAGAPLRIERMPQSGPDGPALLIIAVLGTKGGVGATTVTANLATAMAYGGLPVVALDLDPQNSLHPHFGLDPVGVSGIARSTLVGQDWSSELREAVPGRPVAADGFSMRVLPHGLLGDGDRENFERHIGSRPGWLLDNLRQLDLPHGTIVLVDLPAKAGSVVRDVLKIAHAVITVTLADAASYLCMPQMERLIRNWCLPRQDFLGHRCLFNQVDHSCRLGHDMARLLRQHQGGRVFGPVHRDQSVAEALACDMNVLDYDPQAQAAHDLAACAGRLARMLAEGNQRGGDHANPAIGKHAA